MANPMKEHVVYPAMQLKCTVEHIENLRIPGTYRAAMKCGSLDVEVEMSTTIIEMRPGREYELAFMEPVEKDKCLDNYEVCGNAYIVSFTKMDKLYRLILSIGGLLVKIVGHKKDIKLKTEPNKHYILGIKTL